MPIHNLTITNVGPFDDISFDFDSQINAFIGPNNAGKSSVLWTLGDVIVHPFLFPNKLSHKDKVSTFSVQHSNGAGSTLHQGHLPVALGSDYWTSERTAKHVDHLTNLGYTKFIPALRRSTDFRSAGPTASLQAYSPDEYQSISNFLKFTGATHTSLPPDVIDAQFQKSLREPELKRRLALYSLDASLVSDETVIQKIIELHYHSMVKNQSVFETVMRKICEVASDIMMGFPIGFVGIDLDSGGFFPQFETIDGSVPLNTLSQGTQSIIQWLAHLSISYSEYYDNAADFAGMPGVLIIDEIDAHLHPSWQRRIIPTLTKHFPRLQIFCSTHSPLMVAGLKAGQVQLLQRDGNGRVTVSTNETDIAGWTADEILRHFMGVPDPTDIAAEKRLARLQDLQLTRNPTATEAAELEELRQTVSQDLVRSPMSGQLEHFADVLRQVAAESRGDHSDTK